jgi:predicted nucleic acid-binding protein
MRYLLDSCVVAEVIHDRPNPRVLDWLDSQDEISLYLSVVTFGELQKAISHLDDARKREELQDWVEHDLATRFDGRILDIDLGTSERWGQLAGAVDDRGNSVPAVAGLIAATALEWELTVVTKNESYFRASGCGYVNPWDG